jgi:hypothetical protein
LGAEHQQHRQEKKREEQSIEREREREREREKREKRERERNRVERDNLERETPFSLLSLHPSLSRPLHDCPPFLCVFSFSVILSFRCPLFPLFPFLSPPKIPAEF